MRTQMHIFRTLSFFSFCLFSFAGLCQSQPRIVKGQIVDNGTREPIVAASITAFENGKTLGSVSNNQGRFQIAISQNTDSIRFSSIGYHSQILRLVNTMEPDTALTVGLQVQPTELATVVIKSMSADDIVKASITSTSKMLARTEFENNFFYREVIRDRENYFSVAEASFIAQFIPLKRDYKLKLHRGRSKEDVSYTRLFEDYHPGGGPEGLFDKSLFEHYPAFFNVKKLDLFSYHKDSIVSADSRNIYVISFDQRQDVHEALDKGKLYIDAADYSLIKYESENSPVGIAYVKSLTGSDKLFAELLHIDFKKKGWQQEADFTNIDGNLYLSHASAQYRIDYKQPKKNLDLDLTISTEMVATSGPAPITKYIESGEEWKSKNIVANLPTDFDSAFWGSSNIISPTAQLDSIIANIHVNTKVVDGGPLDSSWQYFGRDYFVASQKNDSVVMVPIMKGPWEDDQTAGMLYRTIDGNFSMETELAISKRSDMSTPPENGFQQAGIIIRNPKGAKENYLFLSIGTGGNSTLKYVLKRTDNSKSKGPVDKIDGPHAWLRIEKNGEIVEIFIKKQQDQEWKKITEYKISWAQAPLQAGLFVAASFSGSGPKMKPDLQAIFSHTSIKPFNQ